MHGGPSQLDGPPASSRPSRRRPRPVDTPDADLPDVPVRADGVQLIGETEGFRLP